LVDRARLDANRRTVLDRIADAAQRAGRDPAKVRLVAVTKTVGPETMRALHALGQRDFGENRAQVGVPKIESLDLADARWHFIGHLQRNKAKAVFGPFATLHSLDSERLARAVEAVAAAADRTVDVLLEVNESGEDAKHGVAPDAAEAVAAAVAALPHLRLRGLMTLAPLVADPEAARPCFARLRDRRDRLADATGLALPDLSMGMSNDYPVAVEEGATLVRVGTALYAGADAT